jgi:hypothetical protein
MQLIPSILSAQNITEQSIIAPRDEKEQQRQLIASWMASFKDDYVAHAVWGDNFAKVVETGAVLPAEAVLRTKRIVEYEKGGLYGQRGKKTIPRFSEEIAKSLEVLEVDEEKTLRTLLALEKKEKAALSDEEYNELKQLTNKIILKTFVKKDMIWLSQHFVNSIGEKTVAKREAIKNIYESLPEETKKKLIEFVAKDMSENNTAEYQNLLAELDIKINQSQALRLKHFIFASLKLPQQKLTEEELHRFNELVNKKTLTNSQRKTMKRLLRKEYGLWISFNRNGIEIEESPSYPFRRRKVLLTLSFDVDVCDIEIAYDEYRGRLIDKYLAHKFTQWVQKGIDMSLCYKTLMSVRNTVFGTAKLNCEIRASKNSVAWAYGEIAIVRGKGSEITGMMKGEAILLAPFQNGGEFFSLPLCEPHTVVIGKKNSLEKYSEKLKNMGAEFAYIENLTLEQQALFNCPAEKVSAK